MQKPQQQPQMTEMDAFLVQEKNKMFILVQVPEIGEVYLQPRPQQQHKHHAVLQPDKNWQTLQVR